jgi:hypothetical protein
MTTTPDAGTIGAGRSRRLVRGLAWLAMLAVVSIAGAGLVLALDHPETESARPERWARAHGAIAPRLDGLEPMLLRLSNAAETLGTSGRTILGGLRDLDPAVVVDGLDAGDAALPDLGAAVRDLRASRIGMLEGIDAERLPQADRDLLASIDRAAAGAGELPSAWADVAAAAVAPVRLLRTLIEHDRQVVDATQLGRSARFAEAAAMMAKARSTLTTATPIRDDAVRRGLDVTTLDDLLARTAAYDEALDRLYSILAASRGAMTDEATAALADVEAAERLLPETTDALVIITSDLGGGDATRAVLRIEAARGAIDAAIGG